MAKNNQRNPNLRAATVARVNQLVKEGQTKAGAFEKISAETGRAKDAVQMLYYRAIRASKAGSKPASQPAARPAAKSAPRSAPKAGSKPAAKSTPGGAPKAATPASPPAGAKAAARPRNRARKPSRSAARPRPQAASAPLGNEFPVLLNGIANAINALLKHVEKTVEENKKLREQAERLKAITSLVRGR